MTYPYEWATWLADVLRAAGLEVVEHPGWKTRGLSATSRRFTPKAVVWHHDASAKGDSPGVPDYMIRRFASAAAQTWVDRDGVWHVIAAGRAPHAGNVLAGMPGNEDSIGVETDHTTGEDWPWEQIESLRIGTAAILRRLGVDDDALHFHRTICSPKGRKVDPDGLDLGLERAHVGAILLSTDGKPAVKPAAKPAAKPAPKPAAKPAKPSVSLAALQRAARLDPPARQGHTTAKADALIVERALLAERLLPRRWVDGSFGSSTVAAYAAFQRSLGYRGKDADGIPGLSSLKALGKRRGFEVKP